MRVLLPLLLLAALTDSAAAQARWTGIVDLAIGGPNETRDAYMFNMITGLETDRGGRIVVAQAPQHQVRVYSPAGRHLYSFGRQGAGPGDLDGPCCIAFDAAGKLWIREVGGRRHSIWTLSDSGAKWIQSYPVQVGGPWERLNWDAQGALMYQRTESRGGPMKTVRFHADTSAKVIRQDTLRDAPVDSSARVAVVQKSGGGVSTYWVDIAFTPRLLRAEGPRGQIAEAISSKYEVLWLGPDMKPVRTLTASWDPPPTHPAELQAARDSIAMFAKRMQADVDVNAAKIPARKPALVSLGFDLDGRLWVEKSVAYGKPREADVYDPQGRLIARASWPADVVLRFHVIRGMSGLGLRHDDDGVPSVVRLSFTR